ncbi:hypothetical protein TNCV_1696751 [Trichonephila clavipes]|nr:hypothetical protein TNCV_1696751 [Trichonephila clavipes]
MVSEGLYGTALATTTCVGRHTASSALLNHTISSHISSGCRLVCSLNIYVAIMTKFGAARAVAPLDLRRI